MYSALSWIPRGLAQDKLQRAAPGASSEAADAADAAAASAGGAAAGGAAGGGAAGGGAAGGGAPGDARMRDGDGGSSDGDGDVDIAEVLAGDLDSLALYASNRDDPYLAGDDDACAQFDAEEADDLRVRPTDALVVAARDGEDASVLEVHLWEDDHGASDDDGAYAPRTYVHHDVVLPTLPLCTAVTSIARGGERLNLVAVGCFTPGIDVWDADLVNVLEPAAVLGGYASDEDAGGAPVPAEKTAGARRRRRKGAKKKKKRRPLALRAGSHADAVMALSWNPAQREYLASGSADTTVKIWDVESAHCARTLSHHDGKVQAVAWHPESESALLTGAFDRTLRVCDVRAGDRAAHTTLRVSADVESAQWGARAFPGKAVAATEDGVVAVFDAARGDGAPPDVTWRAHAGAVSACALSHDVPGLLVTACVDKTVRVWDARGGAGTPPLLVHEFRSKAGAVFGAELCPCGGKDWASPFALAYAGAKGALVVTDLAVDSKAVRDAFLGEASPSAAKIVRERAARRAREVDLKAMRRTGREPESEESAGESDSEYESE